MIKSFNLTLQKHDFLIKNFRLFGLTALVSFECSSNWWQFYFPSYNYWTAYLNFSSLIFIYHLIIIQLKWTSNGIKPFGRETLIGSEEDEGSSLHEEVI